MREPRKLLFFLVLIGVIGEGVAADPDLPARDLDRVIRLLSNTDRIESFAVAGAGHVGDSVSNISGYRVTARGPQLDSTLARRIIPWVQRASQGDCGEPNWCLFSPRLALRFYALGTQMDLLVSKDCESMMFCLSKCARLVAYQTSCLSDSLYEISRLVLPPESH
jgi:hypothetical protein